MHQHDRSRSQSEEYVFSIATTGDDREDIYRFRRDNYAHSSAYLLTDRAGTLTAKDEFDDVSHLFLCRHRGIVVSTCRVTPCHLGQWEASAEWPLPIALPVAPDRAVQIGRVVVDRAHRTRRMHEHLFLVACGWTLDHTTNQFYFALSNHAHARLYAMIGAKQLHPAGFTLPQRQGRRYFLLGSFIADTHTILGQRLFAQPPSAPSAKV